MTREIPGRDDPRPQCSPAHSGLPFTRPVRYDSAKRKASPTKPIPPTKTIP